MTNQVSRFPPATFFRAWATAGAACSFELDVVDLAAFGRFLEAASLADEFEGETG